MRLFDLDPLQKIRRLFHWDNSSDSFVIETQQEVTDIVEANKSLYSEIDARARYGEMDRVASIPMNIYMDLQKSGIADDPKAFKRWLNDPDNRVFRTRPGRI
jgi:hypothetical protein